MTYSGLEEHWVFFERQSGLSMVFLPNATLDDKLWEFQIDHFKSATT